MKRTIKEVLIFGSKKLVINLKKDYFVKFDKYSTFNQKN